MCEHGKLEAFKTFSIFSELLLSCGRKMLFEFQCDCKGHYAHGS